MLIEAIRSARKRSSLLWLLLISNLAHVAQRTRKILPLCTGRTPAGGRCRFSTTRNLTPPPPPPTTSLPASTDRTCLQDHDPPHPQYPPAPQEKAITHRVHHFPLPRATPIPRQHHRLCASIHNHPYDHDQPHRQ